MTAYKMVRTMVLVVLMSVMVISTTACNTVKGAGKDVEKVGEKTQDAADAAKN